MKPVEVAEVGFAGGYVSPSHFSREYRRMFGKPPGQDGADLRASPRWLAPPPALSDGQIVRYPLAIIYAVKSAPKWDVEAQ